MTREESGWLFVVALYMIWTYVLPILAACALGYGAYWLGKRRSKKRQRKVSYAPSPLCRDCADRNGTCYDGSPCDPRETHREGG